MAGGEVGGGGSPEQAGTDHLGLGSAWDQVKEHERGTLKPTRASARGLGERRASAAAHGRGAASSPA